MNERQAGFALALLIVATPDERKWTDDKLAYFKSLLQGWNDAEAGLEACRKVAETRFLPPEPRALHEAYRAEVVRRQMEVPALPEGSDRPIPWREGLEIARRNYGVQCHQSGRLPTDGKVESFLARCYEDRTTRRGDPVGL